MLAIYCKEEFNLGSPIFLSSVLSWQVLSFMQPIFINFVHVEEKH